MSTKLTPVCKLSLFALLALPSVMTAADTKLTTTVAGKIGYDTNVYLQDNSVIDPKALTNGQTGVGTKANAASTVLMGSIGLTGEYKNDVFQGTLSYAPERWIYDDYSKENHLDEKVNAAFSGKLDTFTYDGKLSYLSVDGSQEGLIYNRLGGSPAIGGAPVRDRRAQDVENYTFNLKQDIDVFFVRGVLSGSRQDFHTRQRVATGSYYGYANYVDRSDINGGADFGYTVRKDLNVYLAGRYGQQLQDNYLGVINNYSNDYTRVLVGVDGTLFTGFKLNGTFGADERNYHRDVPTYVVRGRNGIYSNLAASYAVTKDDSVNATWVRQNIVSAGGRSAYINTKYTLAYKHTFDKTLSAGLTGSQEEGNWQDFTTSARRDYIYQVGGVVSYTLPCGAKLELNVLRDWASAAIANSQAHVYHRLYTTIGTTYSF